MLTYIINVIKDCHSLRSLDLIEIFSIMFSAQQVSIRFTLNSNNNLKMSASDKNF